ncbi:MAG: amidohydrolase [candidate division WOR-3 bacterium]
METISGYLITEPSSPPFPGKLVIDAGKIAAVLPAAEMEKPVFIVPGFIDCHTHPLENGLTMLYADLTLVHSVDEALGLISDAVRQKPDLPVVLAFNFNPDTIAEHRYLYRRELDRITREKPVFVYRVDGHSGIANSAALALISVAQLPGLEMDGAGRPTGVVRGNAFETLAGLLKRRLPAEIVKESILLTARQAASKGVTTIAALIGTPEMSEPEWQTLLEALNATAIRMVPFLQTWRPDLATQFNLSAVGGCLLLDGSFGSHTAAISGEYADAPGFNGILYQNDEVVVNFINRANELGLQTAFHAIGDRAIEQLVRAHEKVAALGKEKPLRHRIEHAELLTPELIARMVELNLVLCMQPAFEALWGGPAGMYARRLGNRWQLTNPLKNLLQSGIVIAGGSDAPITPLDPLFGIKAAITLPNVNQRLSPADALALFTTNAAYALKVENRTGTIKPGLEADFVITDADPRVQQEITILATYHQGRPIYQLQ